MARKSQSKGIALYACKFVLLISNALIFFGIWTIFYNRNLPEPYKGNGNYAVIAAFLVTYFCFIKIYGGFSLTTSRTSELIYSQCLALLMTGFVLYFVSMLLVRHLPYLPPMLFCLAACMAVSAVWARFANLLTNRVFPPQKTVLIYEHPDAYRGGSEIAAKLPRRFEIVAEISAERGFRDIRAVIEAERAEAVLICGVHSSERNDIVKFCVENGIFAYIRPTIGDLIVSGSQHIQMGNLPVLLCHRCEPVIWYAAVKRFVDIALSAGGLILAGPFILITALIIKLYDGGPVLYKQTRLTKDRRPFSIYKFRSMRVDAEKDGVARLASDGDERITPPGKFIRLIRFDELPQLFNILRGDMSLVGPRPERPEIVAQYEREIPEFRLRLQAKAGLTGYAQVYGKYNTSPYDKLQMDLMYIGNQGLAADLRILLATLNILFIPESTQGVAAGQITAGIAQQEAAAAKEN